MSVIESRNEGMRIGGDVVFTDDTVPVHYPYTNEVVGTVPAGTAEHARLAFDIAAGHAPKLTRYERSQILQRTGELIGERRDYLAKWLTLELGICHTTRNLRDQARTGCLSVCVAVCAGR